MRRYPWTCDRGLGRVGRGLSLGVLVCIVLSSGCTTTGAKERADRETYDIIAEKTPLVEGMPAEFEVAPPRSESPLEGLPVVNAPDPALGPEADAELGSPVVSLEKALALAVRHNRTYQNRREQLFLEALSLTLDRHQYTPLFSARASGTLDRVTQIETQPSDFSAISSAAGSVIREFEAVTGTTAELLREYHAIVAEAGLAFGLDAPEQVVRGDTRTSGTAGTGMEVLLRGGGRIALGLTSNFLRFLTGDARTATASVLSGTFTQPLLQGAGRDIAAERLTQAERDVLYEIRAYQRFRQEFTVQVVSAYYGVLQDRDVVRNNWQSLENFRRNAERERAFAAEGRRSQSELARIEQALLSTEDRWINAVRAYRESLDRFKILLGLSTDVQLTLDDAELAYLREAGLRHPELSAEDAVQVALAARLDLLTARDRAEDAARRTAVAANALKPRLDLVLGAEVPSRGQDRFQHLDLDRVEPSATLNFDPRLNRKAERNAYRAALIAQERAQRDATLEEDNVKLAVRGAWRNLDQARRNYEIAVQSVELNERRVQEQELLAELGRATVLNQVDAQNDLNQARNNLSAALVSHTLARLTFWRDMGILYIKDNGQWEEIHDEPDRPE